MEFICDDDGSIVLFFIMYFIIIEYCRGRFECIY